MEIGKNYDVVFSAGAYEIQYENGVTCIKKTPKSFRVKRLNGTTRLIGHDCIMNLKEVLPHSEVRGTRPSMSMLPSRSFNADKHRSCAARRSQEHASIGAMPVRAGQLRR